MYGHGVIIHVQAGPHGALVAIAVVVVVVVVVVITETKRYRHSINKVEIY